MVKHLLLFLFTKPKIRLKIIKRFKMAREAQQKRDVELRSSYFDDCFKGWKSRGYKCIESGGDHFERGI